MRQQAGHQTMVPQRRHLRTDFRSEMDTGTVGQMLHFLAEENSSSRKDSRRHAPPPHRVRRRRFRYRSVKREVAVAYALRHYE